MKPLAHSANPESGVRAQPYAEHVANVIDRADKSAREVAKYAPKHGERLLLEAVCLAAEFHDLGKLHDDNQEVLASSTKKRLPLNHVDAGVAHLIQKNLLSAALVYAHHIGLPDFQEQRTRKAGYVLRDDSVKHISDQQVTKYLKMHQKEVPSAVSQGSGCETELLTPLVFRVALSCLVDADHYDAAHHDNRAPEPHQSLLLNAEERLNQLDEYVRSLGKSKEDKRTCLRNAVYKRCRDTDIKSQLYACDAPVGTGKTTAVMAHLLQAAAKKGLRRIFVVLPFTNIIDQSVEVYRNALVLPQENKENVVAAHHHRAEFDDIASRPLAFLWESPIVVTTAVQFFETLASNHPAALRKLHNLPGSAIFIDEAHAALPSHLLPQAWEWLQKLCLEWGCHLVLGSGSLNRFWELEEFSNPPASLPDLISDSDKSSTLKYEHSRVKFTSQENGLSLKDLTEWLPKLSGPRLLIVNTIQSAAVIAAELARVAGRHSVEHLSTSLCPRDRNLTLRRVIKRLSDTKDCDWTLVATSCVEAGVDLSFRTGLRERCSLNSLLQIGGRVNRHGEYNDAQVWDFQLQHNLFLKQNPSFDASADILGELFRESKVAPEFCTEGMRREIRQVGLKQVSQDILKAETNLQFPSVTDKFKVIDSDTVTAVVETNLINDLEAHKKVDRIVLQSQSVQIWRRKCLPGGALTELALLPGLYKWNLLYDEFLGYMAGVLQVLKHQQYGSVV